MLPSRADIKRQSRSDSPEEFNSILEGIDGKAKPIFVLIKIKAGTVEGLPRPSDTPEEMKNKFTGFLKKN